MRLSPRLLFSLALGSGLLTFPATLPVNSAESNPGTGSTPPTANAPSASDAPSTPDTASAPETSTPADAQPAEAQPATFDEVVVEDPAKYALKPVKETDEERAFIHLANQERIKRGLNPLVIDPLLTAVARLHAAEMRDRNYFNHQSPVAEHRTPLDRYLVALNVRPAYACVGENLYYSTVADVQRGHRAFMNSPTHRENVLFPRFEKIGVGIIRNARGEFWVTQMFLTNRDPGTRDVAKVTKE